MVRGFVLFGLIALMSCAGYKYRIGEHRLQLEPNWQLNYNLTWGGQHYQFIVDIVKMGPDREFDFTMTNMSKTKGHVIIDKTGISKATKYRNGFSAGENILDKYTSTVWMARGTFRKLARGQKASFNPSYGEFWKDYTFERTGYEWFEYELNGVPLKLPVMVVKCIDFDAEGEPPSFRILNDPSNPLIIDMFVGWRIQLKEINHN